MQEEEEDEELVKKMRTCLENIPPYYGDIPGPSPEVHKYYKDMMKSDQHVILFLASDKDALDKFLELK